MSKCPLFVNTTWVMPSLTPVSYTHLDVYKRQILDTAFNGIIKINAYKEVVAVNHMIENLLGKTGEELIGFPVDKIMPGIDAVSYTHLDVYKRQISINDGYDSADYNGMTSGVDMAFRNVVYAYYSKDISEKVRSGKRCV